MADPKISRLTVNLARQTKGVTFKKRGPRSIKIIRKLVTRQFKPDRVIIDTSVNKKVWERGIRTPPRKIHLEIETITTEDEDGLATRVSTVRLPELAEDEE